MFFVRRSHPDDAWADQALNGRMYARTSLDGVTWTAPQSLGIYTNDAVDITCASANGNCLMTYVCASSNTTTTLNRAFTVNGSTITLGSVTEDPLPTPWTPAAGVRTYAGANDWFIGAPEDNTGGGRLLFYDRDSVAPIPTLSFTNFATTKLRGSFVSIPGDSRIYAFYLN